MNENGVRLVCFEISGEKFAFNMDFLVEFVQVQQSEITPFFSSIPVIRGFWNYRGKTIYLLDVHDFFGFPETAEMAAEELLPHEEEHQEKGERKHLKKEHIGRNILVIKIRERIFGLLVDTVLQVVPLITFYEFPGMITTLPRRYFAGVTLVDSDLVILLALEELINEYEFEAELSRIDEGEVPPFDRTQDTASAID